MTAECGQCHISIYQEDSICCDGCNLWFHLKCSKLTKKTFKAFTVQQNKEWYCATCTICKKCNKIRKGNSIWCDVCNRWYHNNINSVIKL